MGASKLQNTKSTIQPVPSDNNNNLESSYVSPSQVNNQELNNISNFYNGTSIFITGATGFVGKALLEKLLRSCDGIVAIYVMVRPKRGMGVEQRIKELLKNPVFDRLREKKPDYFDKIKVMSGDVTQPNLGLCETDRQTIVNNVNIVFHSAATVKFNESLKDAVILNTLGTKRVMKLCNEMRKLKSFIHVSTAYSNADKREIQEMIYESPHDPHTIISCIETLSNDTLNQMTEKLQGNHPNTYTLTKAMAESIVLEYYQTIPTAIVRPSIVTAAWKEPFPGWVDNVSGVTGIMMEIGRGTIRSIICDDRNIIDCIPVDIVVNTLITAAWHNAVNKSNTVRVYNCTSGQINGIYWHTFGELTEKYSIEYPSKYVSWYPNLKFRTNKLMHFFCHWFLHVIPACMLDVVLYATNHKPIMLRICRKFAKACNDGTFFSTTEFKFDNGHLKWLVNSVKLAEDSEEFSCDISKESGFVWEDYMKDYIVGIRQYVLKDDLGSLGAAKAKLQKLYWAFKVVQFASVYMLLRYILR